VEEWLNKAMAAAASPEQTQRYEEAHSMECGFVVVRPADFDHRLKHDGVVAGVRRIALLQGLLEAFAPKGIRREAETLVAVLVSGEQALHLGLTLAQFKEAYPVSVAVGAGKVIVGPDMELHGFAIQQVRHLVTMARPHELLIPKSVLDTLTLPQGVGVFAAPEVLEETLHFESAILRDFRGATPVE
jgi:class 3 adenylate cyclase